MEQNTQKIRAAKQYWTIAFYFHDVKILWYDMMNKLCNEIQIPFINSILEIFTFSAANWKHWLFNMGSAKASNQPILLKKWKISKNFHCLTTSFGFLPYYISLHVIFNFIIIKAQNFNNNAHSYFRITFRCEESDETAQRKLSRLTNFYQRGKMYTSCVCIVKCMQF